MGKSPSPLRRGLTAVFLFGALAVAAATAVALLTPDKLVSQGLISLSPIAPTALPETPPIEVSQPTDIAAPADSPSAASTGPSRTDVAGPADSPSAASTGPSRVVISKIGVDAPLVVKGIDASGVMQVPDGPEDVAWYGFTARPGEGGNIVLSGHVDFRGYGPAVFARLRELTRGDIVEVRLRDGSAYQYVVTQSVAYEAEGAPVEEIVGPTSRETVTLITCDGTFNGASLGYSHRLVVRAERF